MSRRPRGRRVKSAAFGGTGATRSPSWGASMARTHDLPRLAGGATMWARRRGAPLSHGHGLGAAEPRRWRPDRDRSYPEVLTPWHCRAGCRARLRTRRRIRPGPRSFRPKHHSSASTGFAAPPPRGVSGAAAGKVTLDIPIAPGYFGGQGEPRHEVRPVRSASP